MRSEHHVLDAVALVVEHDIEDFVILAIDRVPVDGLYFYILAVGVLVAGLGKLRLIMSSGVVSLGGVFSSGPSWARAGKATSPHARTVRQISKRADTDFMCIV